MKQPRLLPERHAHRDFFVADIVRTDLNLTHPADLDVTRGWVPAV